MQEVYDILQEECAEVIQAISKIRRFGLETSWKGATNQEHLETEVGDLLQMVQILTENGILRREKLVEASAAKREKLQKWSTIFADKEQETVDLDS